MLNAHRQCCYHLCASCGCRARRLRTARPPGAHKFLRSERHPHGCVSEHKKSTLQRGSELQHARTNSCVSISPRPPVAVCVKVQELIIHRKVGSRVVPGGSCDFIPTSGSASASASAPAQGSASASLHMQWPFCGVVRTLLERILLYRVQE